MTDTASQDPAAIEREIRRTQENMSHTVDRIGDQLSIKNVVNALLDKADKSNVDARMLLDGARRNPVALGLIAAGAIWLVSDKDSTLPSFPSSSGKTQKRDDSGSDVHHRDYVAHMSGVEQRADEDDVNYQRRRDAARSNFFMLERDQDEGDSGFRQRLDDMTRKFREKRHAWADQASDVQDAGAQKARAAATKVQDLFAANPLVGGIIAAAIGAAFGSAVPLTEQEQDKLGSLGEKARDLVDDKKEAVASQLHDKKDELLDKADAAIRPSAGAQEDGGAVGQQSEKQPFMIAN